MTFSPEEFAAQTEQVQRVMVQIESLRASGDRGAWVKMRRLVIAAPCCPRSALVEVIDTDPPCVLVRQITYGRADSGDERKPWSGSRRGDQGFVWLSAFEQMAETGARQMVSCTHGRWWVSATDVTTHRGRHVLSLSDNPRHTR